MTDRNAVAATIRETVANTRTKTLTGGQIWLTVRTLHPDFKVADHSKNLRAFIQKFVPDLKERSRAGADILYALVEPNLSSDDTVTVADVPLVGVSPVRQQRHQTPLRILHEDRRVWKTFTSPNSPWRIFLEPEASSVRIMPPGDSVPGSSWIEIPNCSAEVLLQIANDFVAALPGGLKDILTETLKDKKWWLPFFEVLGNVGLKTRWIVYRRNRISDEFEKAVDQALKQRPQLPPATLIPNPTESPKKSLPAIPVDGSGADSLLRRLAIEAVGKMTETELRKLNLPLGYVVDALESR